MGGLPCYLSYQVAFLIQPSLASTNSGIGVGGHFEFGGTAAMTVAAETAAREGSVTAAEPPDLIAASTVIPSVGTTAMVFAIQAPHVRVGLRTLSAVGGAKVGVFADVATRSESRLRARPRSFRARRSTGTSPLLSAAR